MAEHDYRRSACPVVFISDCASPHGLHAQPGIIAAGHDLSPDDLCLLAHHGIQFTERSEGKEIAERAVRRGLRQAHPGKDFMTK